MTSLRMFRGEAKTWQCVATNNGQLLNLTGAVIYHAVRPDYPGPAVVSDADATIKKVSTTPAEITVIDAVAGSFEIYYQKSDTNSLNAGNYRMGTEVLLSGATSPVVVDQRYLTIDADIVRAA